MNGGDCMRTSMICTPSTNITWVIKKNEMGRVSGKDREEDRCIRGFGGKETIRATYAYTGGKY